MQETYYQTLTSSYFDINHSITYIAVVNVVLVEQHASKVRYCPAQPPGNGRIWPSPHRLFACKSNFRSLPPCLPNLVTCRCFCYSSQSILVCLLLLLSTAVRLLMAWRRMAGPPEVSSTPRPGISKHDTRWPDAVYIPYAFLESSAVRW